MKAMTPGNIYAAFKATVIFPFDRHIFTDLDFKPSDVIDGQVNVGNDENEFKIMNKEFYPRQHKSFPVLIQIKMFNLKNLVFKALTVIERNHHHLVKYNLLELHTNIIDDKLMLH